MENSGRDSAKKPGEWAAAAAARKRPWDSGESQHTAYSKHPRINAPLNETLQVSASTAARARAPWLDRINVSAVVKSGPFGRVVVFEGASDNPASIVERTASASQMTTSFNFVESKQGVSVSFYLFLFLIMEKLKYRVLK